MRGGVFAGGVGRGRGAGADRRRALDGRPRPGARGHARASWSCVGGRRRPAHRRRSTPASRPRSSRTCAAAARPSSCTPAPPAPTSCSTARRRLLPRQRPGRPGGAGLRRRHGRELVGQARRSSASASATSCSAGRWAWRPTSCPSATAAPTTRSRTSRPGRIEITSQNHGFAVLGPGRRAHDRRRRARALGDRLRRPPSSPTSTSTTAPSRAWRSRTSRAPPSSTTRRPAPGPHDSLYLFDRFLEQIAPDAAQRRHREDPRPRLRPDRDRPGGRVRLLGRAGLQGAAGGGLRGRARQLQPGDDHDRPGVRRRRPTSSRCCPGRCAQVIEKRAPRRAAAHAGRPDRAEPRPRAARGRHARALRRRADRRRLRRDPPRRGPRPVPRDDGRARACACPRSAIATRVEEARGRASTTSACPRSSARRSRSAAGRRRRAHEPRVREIVARAASPPRRSARSCSTSRCSAGASSSSRSCATATTTW